VAGYDNRLVRWRGRALRLLAGVALLAGFGLAAHTAHAQTVYNFTVNTTADTPDVAPGDGVCNDATGKCSVRAATQEANALVPPAGGQIIVNVQIPANTYILTLGELELLNNTINLNGAAASSTTISGNNASRVFYVGCTAPSFINCNSSGNTITNAALVTIQNLTITAGNGTGARGRNGLGGGIFSSTTLTLVSDVVNGNTATSSVSFSGCFSIPGPAAGGGLYQAGYNPLTIQSTTFSGNLAVSTAAFGYACGGALLDYDGTSNIRSSTFTNNVARAPFRAQGGAIANDEQETLAYDTISNNQAVSPATASTVASAVIGGGIYNDYAMQIVQSTISNNQALDTNPGGQGDGGGIDNDSNLSISGPTRILSNTLSTSKFASGGGIENDDFLFMSGGAIVSQNIATATGSAGNTRFCAETSTTSTTWNACVNGGGISNYDYLNMHTVSITFNQAIAKAGTGGTNAVASGGGLGNYAAGTAAQNVNIASNSVSATAPLAANAVAIGGGVWTLNTPLNLQNSYVQSNSSTMDGGGIYDGHAGPGYVSLSYSQVMRNTAAHKGGGVFNSYPVTQTSSPIFGNSAPICPQIVVPCH
jgi:CSLREA domain-containing protein